MRDAAPTDHPAETPPDLDPEKVIDRETIRDAPAEEIAERADVDEDAVEAVVEAFAEYECDRHPWRDPRVLARLYYSEGLTQAAVAEEIGTTRGNVGYWMGQYEMAPGRAQVWNRSGGENDA